ncbi:hypothetical protein RT41_GL001537 [Lactococcus fujiensis JCM 16395]|uniref:VOC domain-containing protein n=2 Tax=Lactococcus fujiensis TaxID=610251 RepID=A0A2A5RLQ4_9LACT|nr:hypothetical protein RT41_GL001537 [Lactococcus fujiensis JCM 16395]
MCTNLYVEDVKAEAEFFKAIGFFEVSRQKVGESDTFIMAPTRKGNARLQIWDIEFIRQMSPEVADDKPSILFTVTDGLEALHEKVAAQGLMTSPISKMGENLTFNFQTPSGSYFAFMQM